MIEPNPAEMNYMIGKDELKIKRKDFIPDRIVFKNLLFKQLATKQKQELRKIVMKIMKIKRKRGKKTHGTTHQVD